MQDWVVRFEIECAQLLPLLVRAIQSNEVCLKTTSGWFCALLCACLLPFSFETGERNERRKWLPLPAPSAISGQNRAFPVIFHIKAISTLHFLGKNRTVTGYHWRIAQIIALLQDKGNLELFSQTRVSHLRHLALLIVGFCKAHGGCTYGPIHYPPAMQLSTSTLEPSIVDPSIVENPSLIDLDKWIF